MDQAMLDKLIRFQRPDRNLPYLPGLDEDRIAALFGMAPEAYRDALARFEAQARSAAETLLKDPDFTAAVDRLPFRPGQRVLALGESSTADRVSWFEILRHLVATERPESGIDFVNLAVSGRTSTEAKAQMTRLAYLAPDWILCSLGGNDVMRFTRLDRSRQVSRSETERNLTELRAGSGPSANWVWLTPNSVDPTRVAAFLPFQRAGITWDQSDIDQTAEFLTARPEASVDTREATAPRGGAEMHLEDGVHLTEDGQQAVAVAVVAALTA